MVFDVEDNGPGMTDDTKKRVFEPFFTTGYAKSGSGLGLAVVNFVVTEQHRGNIDVFSTPGKGTRFSIYLPIYPDPHVRTAGFSLSEKSQ